MKHKPTKNKPGTAEVKAKRDWLKAHGLTNQEAQSLIKATRTRHENSASARAWLKTRPKAKA